MKKLFFFLLSLLSLTGLSQISFDSIGYKSYLLSIDSKTQKIEGNSEVLFFFNNNKVISTTGDQMKSFYLKTIPKEIILATGNKTTYIECIDNGGFRCTMYIGYISKTDVYFIAINYNNIFFFFECRKTDERPWDNDSKEFQPFEIWKGNYTNKEVNDFLHQFGDPEILKKAMMQDLFFNNR